MQRDMALPKLRADVTVAPETLNEKNRTIEVRFYSGASVQRYPLFDEPYELSFSLDAKAVRLDRFNKGAPVLDNHNGYDSVSSVVLGKVEKAWLAEDGGRALIRFSKRDVVEPIWQDVKDGILTNFSMGAVVHRMEDVTAKGDPQRKLRAVDWEPHELSLVPIPADPAAQALAQAEKFPCHITFRAEDGAHKEKTMETETTTVDPKPEVPAPKADLGVSTKVLVDDIVEKDKAHQTELKRLASHFGCEPAFLSKHIALGTDVNKFAELAAEDRARRAPRAADNISLGEDYESGAWRLEQMGIALAGIGRREKLPESAHQYGHHTMVEMAYECLSIAGRARGLNPRSNPNEIIKLALTSSDFPNLLANAANKMLLPDYEQANPTYRMLAERVDLPDFKTASVLKVGDFPVPLQFGEANEIKLGTFSEAKDTFALSSYGRRVHLSFQSIVNDDKGAFARVMGSSGRRLADFENGLWFTLLTSNSGVGPTLGDTGALFNATAVTTAGGHANYTSSGTAIDVTSIGVGRAMMRKQVSLDGLKLNIVPRYILTSPDKETIARQYTTVLGPNLAASSQNPWAGMLEPISDGNLTSANPWYLFADPMRAPVSVYGYLQGQAGPDIAVRNGFETLGVEIRVALHFGTAFIDFRGAYRNAGA